MLSCAVWYGYTRCAMRSCGPSDIAGSGRITSMSRGARYRHLGGRFRQQKLALVEIVHQLTGVAEEARAGLDTATGPLTG